MPLPINNKVLHCAAYRWYFTAQLITIIGTAMQTMANAWLVLSLTGTHLQVALTFALTYAPGFFCAPWIGAWIDRYPKKYLAMSADCLRAIALLMIPLLAWHDRTSLPALYGVILLVAIGDQVFTSTTVALIHEIVPRDILLSANAMTQIAVQIGSGVGVLLGGVILTAWGPLAVFCLNSASFLISCLCISQLSTTHIRTPVPVRSIAADWRAALQHCVQHRAIVRTYCGLAAFTLGFRIINALLVPFVKDTLHATPMDLSLVELGYCLGAIAALLLIPRLCRRYTTARVMLLGSGALVAVVFLLGTSRTIVGAALCFGLLGLFMHTRVVFLTQVQHAMNPAFQGRIHSSFMAFTALLTLPICLGIGYGSDHSSPLIMFCLTAMSMAALFGWSWFDRQFTGAPSCPH